MRRIISCGCVVWSSRQQTPWSYWRCSFGLREFHRASRSYLKAALEVLTQSSQLLPLFAIKLLQVVGNNISFGSQWSKAVIVSKLPFVLYWTPIPTFIPPIPHFHMMAVLQNKIMHLTIVNFKWKSVPIKGPCYICSKLCCWHSPPCINVKPYILFDIYW